VVGLACAVVAGGVVGALVAPDGGADDEPVVTAVFAASAGPVEARDCPDGAVVATFAAGDRVQATGTDGGDWVEVRSPNDLADRVWIERSVLDPDRTLDGLATVACGRRSEPGTPSTSAPGAPATTTSAGTTTTVPVTTGPEPTAPPTTSGPTTAPDTTAPSVTQVGVSPTQIVENDPAVCAGSTFTTTLTATVADAGGLDRVVVRWSVGGRSGEVPASRVGGTYRATIGPFATDTLPQSPGEATVTLTVRATDQAGNVGTATTTLTLFDCTFI
jgi:hypothetical protein